MRVAITTPEFLSDWGGVGTYAALLAKNLPEEFEVHVITLRPSKEIESLKQKEVFERAKVHIIGSASDTFIYNSQFQFNLMRKFRMLQKEGKFDILHANHAQMPDLLLKFFKVGIPSVTTVHTTLRSQMMGTSSSHLSLKEMERSEKMTALFSPALLAAERMYIGRCENLIFVSNYIQKLFEVSFGKPKRFEVIHNGIDTDLFRPRDERECYSYFPMLEGHENIILFIGRMLALKGLDVLIDSFAKIIQEIDAHLVLAGAGSFEPWRKRLIRNNIPGSKYTFLGKVPHYKIPFLYPLASVFTLPSYSESFPLTILEAMSCGVPVVATNVGGLPEMIEDGVNGFLVEPGDPATLAQKIFQVIHSREKASELARKGRYRAVIEFSAKRMANETAEMYKRVIGVVE
ncbi:MAG: glycosyltransferase family 4 protein [Methanomassiliicoccales archaeon]|jgi:glycosyltransferase involved in cell wall biosynthesis|nr:glycosyltransferase family 4 protein [Methanomassiliicoccales archaeon]